MIKSCDNCKYWVLSVPQATTTGDCRRHSPQIGPRGYHEWARTKAHYWCGDYRAKRLTK